MKKIYFILILLISSCSSILDNINTGSTVEILSNPSGAEIRGADGKIVGVTPFLLKGDKYEENVKDQILNLSISLAGYHEKDFLLMLGGQSKISVKLKKYTQDEYIKFANLAYAPQIEDMLQKVVIFHERILSNDLKMLDDITKYFVEKYPDISMSWVLIALANIKHDRKELARSQLQKALLLNPNNIIAKNYMKYLKK